MKRVYADEKWCLGCRLCEHYCRSAGIRVEEKDGTCFAVSCRHCRDPLCVKGCITGALYVKDGIVSIDRDKCVSCYTCILSCPFGAIFSSEDGAVQKCELCTKTPEGNPACVRGCPNGAIVFEERG